MATREIVAEEGALVARASSGDRDAMAELYNRHFDGVYDFVRRLMRDADEAADVVQDVFLKAMTAMGSLKKGERFRSWLFSIAHNMALNRLDKQKRISRPRVGDEDEGESRIYQQVDTDRLADPQAALVDQQTASLVWEAAAGLDRRQYALLDLHVRQGLDSAEIAQVMGVSKGNAYTMVSRLKSAVEESITAYLMARRGRKECPVLNDILVDQQVAGMTPDLRRLVNNHVSECPACQRTKKRIVSPVAILSAFAAVPPPFGLKESIFQTVSAAASGPPPGDGGAGSASGRSGLRAGARDGMERMIAASRAAIGSLPRSRLMLLLAGGVVGIGGALIVGLLALSGAISGDGDSVVTGTVSGRTPTPTYFGAVFGDVGNQGPEDTEDLETLSGTLDGDDDPPPEEPFPEEPTPPEEPWPPEEPPPADGPTPTATPAPPPVPPPAPTATPVSPPAPTPTPVSPPAPTPTPAPMELEVFDATRTCSPVTSVTVEWWVSGDPNGTVQIWRWFPGDLYWVRVDGMSEPGEGVGTMMELIDSPGNVTVWYQITARNSADEPLDLPLEQVMVEVPWTIC